MNVLVGDFSEQIEIYLNNALLLSESLKVHGYKFTLLTNNKRLLQNILIKKKFNLELIEIEFPTKFPSGVRFFSAHSKIDAFRYLSQQNHNYVVFCDLDMVCLKKIPDSFQAAIDAKIPLVYEITDQVFEAYGEKIVMDDVRTVRRFNSEGKWIGGEFLSGTPDFFEALCLEIDTFIPKYFESFITMNHNSDEALITPAIDKLRNSGLYISDAGLNRTIGRYWSSNTLHTQKNFNFYEDLFLLHLPADKKFLSELVKNEKFKFSKLTFLNRYKQYLKKILVKKIKYKIMYSAYLLKAKIFRLFKYFLIDKYRNL